MKTLAIFDFDGTLTLRDSFLGFARFAIGRPRLSLALLLSSPWLIAWKLRLTSSSNAKQHLFSRMFRHMPLSRFDSLGQAYIDKIDTMLRHDTYSLLRQHKANGATVVIASASLQNWISPWAKRHGVDLVVATRPQIDPQGRLTGRFDGPNCLADQKILRLKQAIPDLHTYDIHAYGNIPDDAPLLAIANHPHAV